MLLKLLMRYSKDRKNMTLKICIFRRYLVQLITIIYTNFDIIYKYLVYKYKSNQISLLLDYYIGYY